MRFLRIEAMAGAALLFATLVALLLSNSPWSGQFLSIWQMPVGVRIGDIAVSRSLQHWINDGLMTLFFFVVALELKREMVLGELQNVRTATLSFAAALGGMLAPAGVFLLVQGSGEGGHGWGVVMATDTAFVIGALAVLGSRIPLSLRLFLLSLAIFDDVGAILVLAIGYGGALHWPALALAATGLAAVAMLSRLGIRSIPVYFVIGGGIWLALDASGIHPTLAGVLLGLMTPARSWVSDIRLHAIFDRVVAYPPGEHWTGDTKGRQDLRRAGVAAREAVSPIERLEMLLHPWVAFAILPLFALANAGVNIAPAEFHRELAIAVFAGFVLGKPLGVVAFAALAVVLRVAVRPSELSWSMLAAGAMLTGIGFTMALFIAEMAFSGGLLTSAKLGILAASAASAAGGLLALIFLTSRVARRDRLMR
ncbi:Na+/H+ antiporter NhaA [Xanthobacter versatilis]|uniref:Na+/H+ antiporter NhaA n=1 Tax=Xanthobacter autotrophicus (strain ATCC BAA-1158 / Py2) TaxID=78245 RepID=UPI0037286080